MSREEIKGWSRRSRDLSSLIGIVVMLLLMPSCKPSEKNYKEAYDAAVSKREALEAEAMIPASGLLSDDGPSMRVVEGDTLYVTKGKLRMPDGVESMPYNVAVSAYKMSTNAKANAESLKEKGYDSMALEATGNKWYTIAGRFTTIEEARAFILEFKKKNKNYSYIGLPGAPVIVGGNK